METLSVTIPDGLKSRCRKAAAEDQRNLSQFVSVALEAYLRSVVMTSRQTP